jgi:hypothetical protein
MEFLKALPMESTDTRYAAWGAAGASASATQDILGDMRSRVCQAPAYSCTCRMQVVHAPFINAIVFPEIQEVDASSAS